jgi:hypothetical protein
MYAQLNHAYLSDKKSTTDRTIRVVTRMWDPG